MAVAPTRRKAYPDDVFTWLTATTLLFLVAGLAVSLYFLQKQYGFFS